MELLSSILPVIVLLLVGFVCRRRQIITAQGIDGLQSLVGFFAMMLLYV